MNKHEFDEKSTESLVGYCGIFEMKSTEKNAKVLNFATKVSFKLNIIRIKKR